MKVQSPRFRVTIKYCFVPIKYLSSMNFLFHFIYLMQIVGLKKGKRHSKNNVECYNDILQYVIDRSYIIT